MKGKSIKAIKDRIHKKQIIIFCVIAVIIIVGAVVRNQFIKARDALLQASIQTEKIQRRDLVTSVSATGKVVSETKLKESVSLTNVKVTGVDVQIGDRVKVGDMLCSFDVEDIEDSLDSTQETLDVTNAQNKLSISSAQSQLASARKNEKTTKRQSARSISSAKSEYNDAKDAVKDAEKTLTDARKSRTKQRNAYEKAKSTYEKAKGTPKEEIARQQKEAAKTAYETSKTTASSAKEAVKTAKKQRSAAYTAYQNAIDTAESSNRSSSDAVDTQEVNVKNSKLTAKSNTITTKQQLENYKKQLEMGNVTASSAGMVTAVNVEEGAMYSGGTIVTIEDTNALLIEAEIDEYDISKVEEDMDVVIKTDATGDEELRGTVTRVCEIATSSSSQSLDSSQSSMSTSQMSASSSSSATYTVRIAFSEPNDAIRLGMSAKLSIILEEKKGVLTVPYNAVEEKENGNCVITVQTPNGETAEIPVTVGLESDYYTEITAKNASDSISEDTIVVVPTSGSGSSLQDMMESRGAMGGF